MTDGAKAMNTLQKLFGPINSEPKNQKRIRVFIVLVVLTLAFFVLSLVFGSTEISLKSALSALFSGNYASSDFRILFYLRLPRSMAALLAGSALAVSGVLIQAVLQNPMAAPNVIGVNSGAGLAASVTIAMFPTAISVLPITSFFGALLACLLIYAISQKSNTSKLTITLIGIAVTSVLNAGINTIKVFFPDSVYDSDLFMIGGFSGVTYNKIIPAGIVILFGLVFAVLTSKDTDILSLGENTAKSLGLNIRIFRFFLLIIASALAGSAVSFSGLLGFVGLLVPHITRKFIGNKHRYLIPASALAGSVLVLSCDLFSRVAFAPFEIPVGIVLSFIGGIFFICLVLFMKRGEQL